MAYHLWKFDYNPRDNITQNYDSYAKKCMKTMAVV